MIHRLTNEQKADIMARIMLHGELELSAALVERIETYIAMHASSVVFEAYAKGYPASEAAIERFFARLVLDEGEDEKSHEEPWHHDFSKPRLFVRRHMPLEDELKERTQERDELKRELATMTANRDTWRDKAYAAVAMFDQVAKERHELKVQLAALEVAT